MKDEAASIRPTPNFPISFWRIFLMAAVFLSVIAYYFIGNVALGNTAKLTGTMKTARQLSEACGLESTWNRLFLNKDIASNENIWGSYRPGLYFGMKTKTIPDFLSTGILWTAYPQNTQSYRHVANQDELTKMTWIRHDGISFGIQHLIDKNYNLGLITSFIIPQTTRNLKESSKSFSWAQKFVINHLQPPLSYTNTQSDLPDHSFLFYFGLECDRNLSTDACIIPSSIRGFRILKRDPYETGMAASLLLIGYNKYSKWFQLEINLYAEDSPNIPMSPILSYWLAGKNTVTEALSRLQSISASYRQQPGRNRPNTPRIFSDEGDLLNVIEPEAGVAVFQVRAVTPLRLEVILHENIDIKNHNNNNNIDIDYIKKKNIHTLSSEISSFLEEKQKTFDSRFESIFHFESKNLKQSQETRQNAILFSARDIEAAKHALSNVLGGIGFFHGTPEVGDAVDVPDALLEDTASPSEDAPNSSNSTSTGGTADGKVGGNGRIDTRITPSARRVREAVTLLFTTPSRTAFPRGFLWDEGFHQLLVSKWDGRLSTDILRSWLGAMYVQDGYEMSDSDEANTPGAPSSSSPSLSSPLAVMGGGGVCGGGWIPREMILGSEARGRVPAEFITQRVNIANPPTLLLAVDSLINQYEKWEGKEGVSHIAGQEQCKGNEQGRKRGDSQSCVGESHQRDDLQYIKSFLQGSHKALHVWTQWFLTSQAGPATHPGSFRWRGRSNQDGKFLPNTLASGLDDYPRSAIPSAREHHVDLLCWMARITKVMTRIQNLLGVKVLSSAELGQHSGGNNSYSYSEYKQFIGLEFEKTNYGKLSEILRGNIDRYHWSEEEQAYLDVGLHSDQGSVLTEVMLRCSAGSPNQNNAGGTADVWIPAEALQQTRGDLSNLSGYCPTSHPTPMYPLSDGHGGLFQRTRFIPHKETVSVQHISRKGYVSLFPLLLKLVEPSSSRLGSLLNLIESPETLWTPFGLRSISASDPYYRKNNAQGDAPYWRGPIWININYLALSALHHYSTVEGPWRSRFQEIYTTLRRNILTMVLGEYHRTGFFWEQYDDVSGRGIRGHPFTGWTVLVVNIMAESYDD